MATEQFSGTPERADHPVRLTGSPNWHYAAMRRAESAARGITVRQTFGTALGEISADEFAEMRAVQDSYYRLAAAHSNAAHRLERRERARIRIERIVRPAARIALHLRRVVTA